MSYVYFARDPDTGLIKIGTTWRVSSRLDCLRRKAPGIELLASVPGDRRIEERFHTLLAEDHVGHEWFASSPRVQAVVIAVREGWFDLAKLPTGVNPIRSARAVAAWARHHERQAAA